MGLLNTLQYTFHIEAAGSDPEGLIRRIHETGMRAGVGLKPGTPVSVVEHLGDSVDMILVMTVEPVRNVVHCGASTHSRYFVLFSFGSSAYQ